MKTLAAPVLLSGVASAQTIVCSPHAAANVKLAAKEIRRYVCLRTGALLPIANTGHGITLSLDPTLASQEFPIQSEARTLTISGGSDLGALYGACRYAEWLGVRFYLHGDVVPDEPLKQRPVISERGKPLFTLRGVNPWRSHPFGFDAWSATAWTMPRQMATYPNATISGILDALGGCQKRWASNGMVEREGSGTPPGPGRRGSPCRQFLRTMKPEMRVRLNGGGWTEIGGLTGAPDNAFITPAWLDSLPSKADAFRSTTPASPRSQRSGNTKDNPPPLSSTVNRLCP